MLIYIYTYVQKTEAFADHPTIVTLTVSSLTGFIFVDLDLVNQLADRVKLAKARCVSEFIARIYLLVMTTIAIERGHF